MQEFIFTEEMSDDFEELLVKYNYPYSRETLRKIYNWDVDLIASRKFEKASAQVLTFSSGKQSTLARLIERASWKATQDFRLDESWRPDKVIVLCKQINNNMPYLYVFIEHDNIIAIVNEIIDDK